MSAAKKDALEDLSSLPKVAGLEVSPVADTLQHFKILLYGDPGVGKTVLAGSASVVEEMSPILLIDIEGGSLSLRNTYPHVHRLRVKSFAEMQKVYESIAKGETEYRTVVLDSLTEIQKFSMEKIMSTLMQKEPDRDPDVPGMREWGKNIEQIRRLVRAFRDLPVHVIFTALAMTDKDARTGLTKTKPSLSGKLSGEVAAFVDIVAYYYLKMVKGEQKRVLLTTGTEGQTAKDRTGLLPPVIEDPTMLKLYEVAFGATKTNNDAGKE